MPKNEKNEKNETETTETETTEARFTVAETYDRLIRAVREGKAALGLPRNGAIGVRPTGADGPLSDARGETVDVLGLYDAERDETVRDASGTATVDLHFGRPRKGDGTVVPVAVATVSLGTEDVPPKWIAFSPVETEDETEPVAVPRTGPNGTRVGGLSPA